MKSNEQVIMQSALQASDHSIDALTAYVDALEELTELRRQLRACESVFQRFKSEKSRRVMENKQEEAQEKLDEVNRLHEIWKGRREVTRNEISDACEKIK